jgi:transcription antitermination factor NusG
MADDGVDVRALGFTLGAQVDVIEGPYAGDRGVVIDGGVDALPDYVRVCLVRAARMRYLPVHQLEHRV